MNLILSSSLLLFASGQEVADSVNATTTDIQEGRTLAESSKSAGYPPNMFIRKADDITRIR